MNRARATAVMEAHGLDGLVATTTENFIYVSDYLGVLLPHKTLRDRFLAVLPRDPATEIGALVPRIKLTYGAQAEVPVEDIRSYGTYRLLVDEEAELVEEDRRFLALRGRTPENDAEPLLVLGQLLADRGLHRRCRLGVDELGLSHGEWQRLASLLPGVELVDAYDIFRDIRTVKTEAEVRRLREGLRRTHDAVSETISAITAGAPQREIRAQLRRSLSERGLVPRSLSVGVGPSSAYSFTEPLDHRADPGSFVKLDPNALWRGYYADTGRTGVVGEPSDRQSAVFAAVLAGHAAGVRALRPGATAGDVFAAARDATREAGLPTYDPVSLGHSIGLEIYDHPALEDGAETRLEQGMVVNVEVPFYEVGFGGVQIEDTYVITADGADCLSDLDRDLFRVL